MTKIVARLEALSLKLYPLLEFGIHASVRDAQPAVFLT